MVVCWLRVLVPVLRSRSQLTWHAVLHCCRVRLKNPEGPQKLYGTLLGAQTDTQSLDELIQQLQAEQRGKSEGKAVTTKFVKPRLPETFWVLVQPTDGLAPSIAPRERSDIV